MRWLQRLQGGVSNNVRSQAHRLLLRVDIELGTKAELRAVVIDDDEYRVDIYLEGDAVVCYCDCPTFYRGSICAHIWAALSRAEAEGHLGRIATRWSPVILLESAREDELDNSLLRSDSAQSDRPSRSRERFEARKAQAWKFELAVLRKEMRQPQPLDPEPPRRIFYSVDPQACVSGELIVSIAVCRLKKDGSWSKPNRQDTLIRSISRLDEGDRKLIPLLGVDAPYHYTPYDSGGDSLASTRRVLPGAFDLLLPMLCETRRFVLEPADLPDHFQPLRWDDGPPWVFEVVVTKNEQTQSFIMQGILKRDGAQLPISQPKLLISGLVFFEDSVARLDEGRGLQWISFLRKVGQLTVPLSRRNEFVAEMASFPELPSIEFPDDIQVLDGEFTRPPMLRLSRSGFSRDAKLRCELSFDYGGITVRDGQTGPIIHDKSSDCLIKRNLAAERDALARVSSLGVRRANSASGALELAPSRLTAVVERLVPEGWRIEAEGDLYRSVGNFKIDVTSNIDWFELSGHVDFDGERVDLPELLKAVARRGNIVRLGDGSIGVLPQEWLNRYRLLASMASSQNGNVRFRSSQAGVLDALLAAQPEVTFDEGFRKIRQELESFGGIQPSDPSVRFRGTLRNYQREGLAWLRFLRRFGFGGCLADDMGLGKTIQVLALLDSTERRGPALIVVPRSLVFNWKQELSRFTPQLRVLDLTGIDRKDQLGKIPDHDLVIMTYGTLRRDAHSLKDVDFDTVVLDEAQSIKNPDTASAKAARLMKGRYRLALTGTPVENHLGDLWSILEFLNPGLLGTASVFRSHASSNAGTESLQMLAKALRPFILRRTKEQVARELPAKTEQTIYCELEEDQRRLYNELRNHYRNALLGRIEKVGIQQSRMQILEALLRLRQAACHPGLIDKNRVKDPSAKLESLIANLAEVSEGHKALVFSQFTSMLAIVKRKLDEQQLIYEYLDGRTKDRESRVRRFQEDDGCPIFLISLKAGGLGLNLTRAEYVFLLDPWWNPAVEAQAIDRSHRIGQTQHVFAYRLISRDTVEEKVIELQKSKRDLADAIISADNSLPGGLNRETIELLLS